VSDVVMGVQSFMVSSSQNTIQPSGFIATSWMARLGVTTICSFRLIVILWLCQFFDDAA
jgi:hypothetical protein